MWLIPIERGVSPRSQGIAKVFTTSAEFQYAEWLGRTLRCAGKRRGDGSEQVAEGVELFRGIEVSARAEWVAASPVVAELWMIESRFHPARNGDGPMRVNLGAEQVSKSLSRFGGHGLIMASQRR